MIHETIVVDFVGGTERIDSGRRCERAKLLQGAEMQTIAVLSATVLSISMLSNSAIKLWSVVCGSDLLPTTTDLLPSSTNVLRRVWSGCCGRDPSRHECDPAGSRRRRQKAL